MAHDCGFLTEFVPADRVSVGADARDAHATDFGTGMGSGGVRPDAVVWPTTTEEVAAVVSEADDRGVPVTPYAAGTGLEGNAVPAHEGISMDLTRMNDVIEIRPADFQMDVEPGVMGPAIEEAAGSHGLFFPPLPSSGDISTIGGMIANDASGMQTVKYGEVADWLLGLEAVLADGSVIRTGGRAKKTSSGYNLGDLLVGSEGTLAIVTRATLSLAGIPEQKRGGRAVFETLDDAAAAVADAVQSGVDVAKIELVDATSARMANAYQGAALPDAPMVFLEFHANHGIEAEIEFCRTVFESHDPLEFELADEAEMDALWEARKELAMAVTEWDEDLTPLVPGDVTVPISDLPAMVQEVQAVADEFDLLIPTFGHAGDGNLHYVILVDVTDTEHVDRGKSASSAIVERALEFGGTATGEHGVGMGKREYLAKEFGEATVEAMRAVKYALDPNDTLNPGKIFPETAEGGRVRRPARLD
ncbi:MAG: FAD-binding oxidoreductase [Salinirussus sp.]